MARYIQDDEFREWEVFATTGDFGMSDPARIGFRCVAQPELKARAVFIEGDKSDAERAVAELSEEELQELFETSDEVG